MYRVAEDELIFGADLHIVTGFELTVSHMVFFHSHESSNVVGLAKAVSIAQDVFLVFILWVP